MHIVRTSRSSRHALGRRRCRSPFMCAAAEEGAGADSAAGEDGDDAFDPDAVGVAKMRASEIKAELDMRGISYAGIFEKVCMDFCVCGICG